MVRYQLRWMEAADSETLMLQVESGEALYMLASRRLRV